MSHSFNAMSNRLISCSHPYLYANNGSVCPMRYFESEIHYHKLNPAHTQEGTNLQSYSCSAERTHSQHIVAQETSCLQSQLRRMKQHPRSRTCPRFSHDNHFKQILFFRRSACGAKWLHIERESTASQQPTVDETRAFVQEFVCCYLMSFPKQGTHLKLMIVKEVNRIDDELEFDADPISNFAINIGLKFFERTNSRHIEHFPLGLFSRALG